MSHHHPNTRKSVMNSKLTGRDYSALVYYRKNSADDDSGDNICICMATTSRTSKLYSGGLQEQVCLEYASRFLGPMGPWTESYWRRECLDYF